MPSIHYQSSPSSKPRGQPPKDIPRDATDKYSRFYVTASTFNTHRVLKIDRTDPTMLGVTEDGTIYDDAQLDLLLRMVQDGNKSQGGLEKVLEFQ
jgi:hypothetical protein